MNSYSLMRANLNGLDKFTSPTLYYQVYVLVRKLIII